MKSNHKKTPIKMFLRAVAKGNQTKISAYKESKLDPMSLMMSDDQELLRTSEQKLLTYIVRNNSCIPRDILATADFIHVFVF